MSEKTKIKIHVSRDFSFAEFEVEFDPATGEGMPSHEQLCRVFDMLPAKDTQPIGENGMRPIYDKAAAKREENKRAREEERQRRADPPATANQRRLLQKYGKWEEDMTKAEASAALKKLGFN